MTTRYGVHKIDGLWWAHDHYWAADPIAARWFESMLAAEIAALRELPDPKWAWQVVPIPVAEV